MTQSPSLSAQEVLPQSAVRRPAATPVGLWGLSTAVPPLSIAQEQAAQIVGAVCGGDEAVRRRAERLSRLAKIEHRGSMLLEQSQEGVTQGFFLADAPPPSTAQRMKVFRERARDLAVPVATSALEQSGCRAAQITDLVTISCTGFTSPGVDIDLIESLDLPPDVARSHIGFMGCHGAINGLRVASALARTGRTVLVCATEMCSLHLHPGQSRDELVANTLFADGAGAVVVHGAGEDETRAAPWRLIDTASLLIPGTRDLMGWDIGDHGFQMRLAAGVPDAIRSCLRPWLEQWLGQHDLGIADVAGWAGHPGGPRILDAVGQCLDLPREALAASRHVLRRHGNMSSPTVLFVLEHLAEDGCRGPCVMLAFGPGLIAEAALLVHE